MLRFRPLRILLCVAVCTACGLALNWLVTWGLAFALPSDYPDIFGRDPSGRYFMPQHRQRTPLGDVYVDVSGNWSMTRAAFGATWLFRTIPDWHATTYPYPEDVPDGARAQHGPPPYTPPSWAARHDAATTDRNIETLAWGWPFRSLCGEVRTTPHYNAAGKMDGVISAYRFFWTRASGFPGSPAAKLPLRPIWAGALANAALFGFAVPVLVYSCRSIRAARRPGPLPDLRA